MTIWAILPAAGIGRRMGSNTPKQYLPVDGVPVISLTLQKLLAVLDIERIVIALHPQDNHWQALGFADEARLEVTEGGEQRQQSVLNALHQIEGRAAAEDWVLVHDAVRPCVPVADIENLIATLRDHAVGGLLGVPVDNTLKQVDPEQVVTATVDRSHYWNALTPQMFRYGLLCQALQQAKDDDRLLTDEAAAIESLGHAPQMVAGSKLNIKITHDADLELAGMILKLQGET